MAAGWIQCWVHRACCAVCGMKMLLHGRVAQPPCLPRLPAAQLPLPGPAAHTPAVQWHRLSLTPRCSSRSRLLVRSAHPCIWSAAEPAECVQGAAAQRCCPSRSLLLQPGRLCAVQVNRSSCNQHLRVQLALAVHGGAGLPLQMDDLHMLG